MTNINTNKNFNYDKFKKEAIDKLKSGSGIAGKNGAFTPLIKEFLESALSEEINDHLLQKKNCSNRNIHNDHINEDSKDCYYIDDDTDLNPNNKRNGYTSKTIKSDIGQFELNTPRDRDGSFEPQIIKKGQTVLTEDLDKK